MKHSICVRIFYIFDTAELNGQDIALGTIHSAMQSLGIHFSIHVNCIKNND